MQTAELQHNLNRLGFDAGKVDGSLGPMTRTATARFQLACAQPGHNLVVDGLPGPRTWAAIDAVGAGSLSRHFSVAELRTRTRASGPKDGTCWIHRDLLQALEALRAHVGRPLPIISGWRDEAHNRRVGGASRSQHTYGAATELEAVRGRLVSRPFLFAGRAVDFNSGYISLDECVGLRLFGGIGHRGGQVTHVDVRPGDRNRPAVWHYG
jgi:hypothetical protein